MKAIVVRKNSKGALPPGMMLFWSGRNDQLPTGWRLVDNAQSGVFIMGTTPSGVSYSVSGSASHTHTVADTASSGAHTHTATHTVSQSDDRWMISRASSTGTGIDTHSHTTGGATINTTGAHTHTVGQLGERDNLPQYTQFWLMKSNGAAIPIGAIALWSGQMNTIPSGWRHCDGSTQDGVTVPKIDSGYIRIPTTNSDVGKTGGSWGHNHTVPSQTGIAGRHRHEVRSSPLERMSGNTLYGGGASSVATGNHTHNGIVDNSGYDDNHSHAIPSPDKTNTLIPYIQLYYIIKVY